MTMTKKYKILGKFIKDMSSETKDIETYLFVKDHIAKYQLGIDINSKALKNKLIEISTTLKFEDKTESKSKSHFEVTFSTIVKIDEGVKYEIYKDHLGYPTFGIGHLITENDPEHGEPDGTEISEERVNEVFETDVAKFVSESKILFPDLDDLPDVAQQVIVNMAFNMGRPRLSKFKNFIAGVNDRDWTRAAEEMMDSRWATQVGDRAIRLRNQILTLV